MKKQLTPSLELIRPSIELIRQHFTAFMYLILLPGLVYALGSLLVGTAFQTDGSFKIEQREIYGLVILGVAGIWSLVNLGPVTYFMLQAVNKARPELIRTYYSQGLRYSLPLLGLYIVFGLALIIGLLLLIVPGLFVLRRYLLSPYYLVDRQLTIRGALKQSAVDSKPVAGFIWGIIGVQIGASLIAASVDAVPVIGVALGQIIVYTITFVPPLRYREVTAALPDEPNAA